MPAVIVFLISAITFKYFSLYDCRSRSPKTSSFSPAPARNERRPWDGSHSRRPKLIICFIMNGLQLPPAPL